jgi:glutathione S-transferase
MEATALTKTQQEAVETALNVDVLPVRLAQLEQILLKSDGPYFCGHALTTCDLSFYVIAAGLLDGTYCEGIWPNVFAGTPKLLALVDLISAHPNVADWNTRGGGGGLWPPKI